MVTDVVSDKIMDIRSSGKQYRGVIRGLVPKCFSQNRISNIGPVNNYVTIMSRRLPPSANLTISMAISNVSLVEIYICMLI